MIINQLEVKSYYVVGADMAQIPRYVSLSNKGLTVAGIDNCVSGKGDAASYGIGLESIKK